MDPARRREGELVLFTEQGMEGIYAPCVQDFRGITPNPAWSPGSTETSVFHDLDWLEPIRAGDKLTVFDETEKMIFHGVVHKDRQAMSACGYYVSFLPREIPYREFIKWFGKKYRAVLEKGPHEDPNSDRPGA